MPQSSRSRSIVATALLLLVFTAGMIGGYALHAARGPEPRRIQRRVVLGEPLALDSLSLTPEQRRKADSIIASVQPATDSILRETLPRIRSLADSVDRALRGMLNEEQLATLARLRRRTDDRPFDNR